MAGRRDRDVAVLARAVNTYLLNTTELRPNPSFYSVMSILNGAVIVHSGARHGAGVDAVPLTSGSVAELYIEPLSRCFGDYDTMYHFSDQLAIPAGHRLPERLPDYFHDEINVYEVTDSTISGYVYLLLRYDLRRHDDNTFTASRHADDDDDTTKVYLLKSKSCHYKNHGPATVCDIATASNVMTGRVDEPDSFYMSLDWVYSVRFLHWPTQAARWPARHRSHGYPGPAVVHRVVADGCDLVPVAHRLCRDDPWASECQWRLSFSRAELKLMNDWTPVQQLVYHILRTVLKLADITNENEVTVVSNYHIKTLMMWATELHTRYWWNTGDCCIISASARLLNTLALCLERRHCRHYFVDDANLFLLTEDQCQNVNQVLAKLRSVADVDALTALLINKYVRPCVIQVCPTHITRLVHDDSRIEEALSAVARWRLGELREKSWRTLDTCSHAIERYVYEMSLTPQSCHYFVKSLEDVEPRLVPHFIGVACLHVAYRLSTGSPYRLRHQHQLVDVLAILFSPPAARSILQLRSQTTNVKAGLLLKTIALSASCGRSDEQRIQTKLCAAYLYSELQGSCSSGEACLASVYLAALFFDEERYQAAMYHSRLALADMPTTSYAQAELLPSIEDIDVAIGLTVLYDFVGTIDRAPSRYLNALTSNLVASFFLVASTSHTAGARHESPLCDELVRYRRNLVSCAQPLLCDVLLFKLVTVNLQTTMSHTDSRAMTRYDTESVTVWNDSELVRLLTQIAVEQMTLFRDVQLREFGKEMVPESMDFVAMYAFRCGHYARCMQLCEESIENLGDYTTIQEVFMYPELLYLLGDCDLVSLVGLTLLVCPDLRDQIENQFAFRLSQVSLTLYLYTESQLRSPHSPASLAITMMCANRHNIQQGLLNAWTLTLINSKLALRLELLRRVHPHSHSRHYCAIREVPL